MAERPAEPDIFHDVFSCERGDETRTYSMRVVPGGEATLKAMSEVSGPVVPIALILAAVFVPTAAIPGITGRLYQQFAVTIAVSVVLSAFNALTLSPALASLLLKPKTESRGLLGRFFKGFNHWFGRATDGYVHWSHVLIRKTARAMLLLGLLTVGAGFFGSRLPASFVPEEDQGYFYMNVQLPPASSLQRTDATARRIEEILARAPGVQTYNTVLGFSLLSSTLATYNAFYFVTLAPWHERHDLTAATMIERLNAELAQVPEAIAFAFSPQSIPGVGTAGGVTFMLEDRSGGTVEFLADHRAETDRPRPASPCPHGRPLRREGGPRVRPEEGDEGRRDLPVGPHRPAAADR